MCLLWSLIFWELIINQSMSLLTYLNYINYMIGLRLKFDKFVGQVWPKNIYILFVLRMKGLILM